MIRKYAEIFCWKNVSSFCSVKATHIFSAKNFRKLYIESAKIVNEMALNKLVKLTMLWTTRPWYFSYCSRKAYVVGTHKKRLGEALLMSIHNISFCGEIRKKCCYPLLSGAVKPCHFIFYPFFIAPDKACFFFFFFFFKEKHMISEVSWQGASNEYPQLKLLSRNEKNLHKKSLGKALLMSTLSIHFSWEIRKTLYGYPSYLELCFFSNLVSFVQSLYVYFLS